ncbi:MAG: hypothetical protein QF579_03095 [Dehalococcoidia bacterium]|jgi:hypothetical protein|nr:hypothetical protein [Dehalococcoidia bacterium]
MHRVRINIEAENSLRATKVIADLCNVAEIVFNPLKLVEFWNQQADGVHLYPQVQLGRECLPKPPPSDPWHVGYVTTADRDMRAVLEVNSSRADSYLYLK